MEEVILVTGGAGYIGAQTCKMLSQSGYLPVTYDNLSTGHLHSVKWGPFVHGDLRDRKTLDEVFIKFQPKAVIHFAASSIVIESMIDPGKYYDNNVISSIHLLEAMRDHHVTNLVFSSTCATYGNPRSIPITEEHPQEPISPYGTSKLMVEKILLDFQKVHQISSVSLRYFNAAGADFTAEHGEDHTPETHLIPSLIEVALGRKEAFTIYGTDFSTPDGSAIRDYIHIEDLAKAHVSALKWVSKSKQNEQINLGTGIGSSIYEIIALTEQICGKKIPTKYANKRIGEPSHLVAANDKAKKLLNWQPLNSSLEMIIESAWKWHTRTMIPVTDLFRT